MKEASRFDIYYTYLELLVTSSLEELGTGTNDSAVKHVFVGATQHS